MRGPPDTFRIHLHSKVLKERREVSTKQLGATIGTYAAKERQLTSMKDGPHAIADRSTRSWWMGNNRLDWESFRGISFQIERFLEFQY